LSYSQAPATQFVPDGHEAVVAHGAKQRCDGEQSQPRPQSVSQSHVGGGGARSITQTQD